MAENFMKHAFTDSVKNFQEVYGTRHSYKKMEERSGDHYVLTRREKAFIQNRDSFYMASASENGWSYVQFRGGPKGFLKVLDDTTLGFADFRGNGQYISAGNLNATKKTVLFLIDYPKNNRLKIWAEAEVLHAADNAGLLGKVELPDYEATIERVFIFRVRALDWNCPQHITARYTAEEIATGIKELDPALIKSCCPEGLEVMKLTHPNRIPCRGDRIIYRLPTCFRRATASKMCFNFCFGRREAGGRRQEVEKSGASAIRFARPRESVWQHMAVTHG